MVLETKANLPHRYTWGEAPRSHQASLWLRLNNNNISTLFSLSSFRQLLCIMDGCRHQQTAHSQWLDCDVAWRSCCTYKTSKCSSNAPDVVKFRMWPARNGTAFGELIVGMARWHITNHVSHFIAPSAHSIWHSIWHSIHRHQTWHDASVWFLRFIGNAEDFAGIHNSCRRRHHSEAPSCGIIEWQLVYASQSLNSILIRLNTIFRIVFCLFGPNVTAKIKYVEPSHQQQATHISHRQHSNSPLQRKAAMHTRALYKQTSQHIAQYYTIIHVVVSLSISRWNYWKAKSDQIPPFFCPRNTFLPNSVRYHSQAITAATAGTIVKRCYGSPIRTHIYCCAYIYLIFIKSNIAGRAEVGTHVNINILFRSKEEKMWISWNIVLLLAFRLCPGPRPPVPPSINCVPDHDPHGTAPNDGREQAHGWQRGHTERTHFVSEVSYDICPEPHTHPHGIDQFLLQINV